MTRTSATTKTGKETPQKIEKKNEAVKPPKINVAPPPEKGINVIQQDVQKDLINVIGPDAKTIERNVQEQKAAKEAAKPREGLSQTDLAAINGIAEGATAIIKQGHTQQAANYLVEELDNPENPSINYLMTRLRTIWDALPETIQYGLLYADYVSAGSPTPVFALAQVLTFLVKSGLIKYKGAKTPEDIKKIGRTTSSLARGTAATAGTVTAVAAGLTAIATPTTGPGAIAPGTVAAIAGAVGAIATCLAPLLDARNDLYDNAYLHLQEVRAKRGNRSERAKKTAAQDIIEF